MALRARRGWLGRMRVERTRSPVQDAWSDEDLAVTPWTYPGRSAEGSGVLLGQSYVALTAPADGDWGAARLRGTARFGTDGGVVGRAGATLDEALHAAGVASVPQRTLVLAVGSNAAPGVMRRKFAALGTAPVLPFLAVHVRGFAIGHSAHVSLPGFIAATGFRRAGATTDTFASLLDDDQLACLDATEPNYVRRALGGALPVTSQGGARCAQIHFYDSRWGVLGRLAPEPLLPQEELSRRLAAHCPPWRRLLGPHTGPRARMLRLAGDRALREAVRDAWAQCGWRHPSGLAEAT